MGLAIYLDNENIYIFNPVRSNQTLISGMYKRPYWIIELNINNNNNDENFPTFTNRRVFANLVDINSKKYMTRSETAKLKLLEKEFNLIV